MSTVSKAGPRLSALGGTGDSNCLGHAKSRYDLPPAHLNARDLTTGRPISEPLFSQFGHDLATFLAAAVEKGQPPQPGRRERLPVEAEPGKEGAECGTHAAAAPVHD